MDQGAARIFCQCTNEEVLQQKQAQSKQGCLPPSSTLFYKSIP